MPILDETGTDVSQYMHLSTPSGRNVAQSYAPRSGLSVSQGVSSALAGIKADLGNSSILNLGSGKGSGGYSGGGSGGYSGGESGGDVVPLELNYPNAEMASLYGMDQATAYQEALANSAHQREMADLKAAGLNPILTATGGRGAAVFGGEVAYPMYGSSGGSSAGGVTYSGSGGSGKKSSSAKSLLKNYNVQNAVASVASALTMAATKNFSLGATAYYGTKAAFQLFK